MPPALYLTGLVFFVNVSAIEQRRIIQYWVCRHSDDELLFHLEIVKPRNVYHDQQFLHYKKQETNPIGER